MSTIFFAAAARPLILLFFGAMLAKAVKWVKVKMPEGRLKRILLAEVWVTPSELKERERQAKARLPAVRR